jgi:MFS family permease
VLLLPHFDTPITGEMEHVAISWATTGRLANPYSTPTGPTAHVSPLYPILLGSIYQVFGTGVSGHLVQAVFACAISALRCALLVPVAVLLGLGFRTGLIAGALGVVYIPAFNTELRGSWEASLASLFLITLVIIAAQFSRKPMFQMPTAVSWGAFAGIGVLLSPALAPPMAAFLAFTACSGLRQWKRYIAWLSILTATALLVVLPWVIRNERVLGAPVIRSNFGLELSLAYNDYEKASALDPEITDSHPLLNRNASRDVARMGEIAFNRQRERQALDWIRKHPASALKLFGRHILYFWFPPAANVLWRTLLAMMTVFSFAGFAVLVSGSRPAASLIGLIWISFPLIYYVTYWSSRYRYPMDWTLVLCVAVLLDAVWQRFSRMRPQTHLLSISNWR